MDCGLGQNAEIQRRICLALTYYRPMDIRTTSLWSVLVISTAVVACDAEKTTEGATSSATAKATTSAKATATAAANACPAGCKGDGTFTAKCRCEGDSLPPVPFEAKLGTGFQFDQPVWEVTNKTDKDIHWGMVSVYYYDAAGKQLETKIKDKVYKRSRMNGSTLTFKPGETKKMGIGFKQESAPKGAKDMEIVFHGWCYGDRKDKATQQCITIPSPPDDRPKGG